MLGWSSRPAARASRRSRSAARPSPASAPPSTLTATGRSSSRSRAAHTSPIPPAASSAPTRYRPPRQRPSTAPGRSVIIGARRRTRPRAAAGGGLLRLGTGAGAGLPRDGPRPAAVVAAARAVVVAAPARPGGAAAGPRSRARPGAVVRVLLVLQRVHLEQELLGAGPLGRGLRAGDVVQDVQGVLDLVLGVVGHVLAALLAGAA